MRLKTRLCLLLLPVLFLGILPVKARAAEISLSAYAAVLYCPDTEEILFEQNASERLPIASTTKIMTALLTLEEAERDDRPVTVTEAMAAEGSSMGLKPGEVLRLRELAKGMLLVSGNDAANASAIAVGGSIEDFAHRMNRRAKELGMENTHFVTPSGLDDEDHYSTALDMAKLTAAALENPEFREICGSVSGEAEFLFPKKRVSMQNHNRLLRLYEGCIGVKTGFTKKAGRCLVSAAERDGVTHIAVTLNAPDDWNDHRKLLDRGFSRMVKILPEPVRKTVPVTGGTQKVLIVSGKAEKPLSCRKDGDITAETELPRFLYAPVSEGETVGQVRYQTGGKTVLTVPLRAEQSVGIKEERRSVRDRIGQWLLLLFT